MRAASVASPKPQGLPAHDAQPDGVFESILFDRSTAEIEDPEAPSFFGDLNLDQLFAAIAAGKDEYGLQP
ncbi:MAG: hypothetical protein KGJ86_07195, partial [Chloroflexota bacterium]|nr:hypothetical protein [Chloroflexota bacterium]